MHNYLIRFFRPSFAQFMRLLKRGQLALACIGLSICLGLLSPVSHAKITASQAASQAKSSTGGKVISVKKVSENGNITTYRVKLLLKNGRVKTVTISG